MKKLMCGRNILPLLMICFLPWPALAAVDVIETYQDSRLSEKTNVFPDGGKVYLAVSNTISQGGAKTLAVTNQADPPESVTVEVSDDGAHYDLIANDGIFTGMFMVTTKLTLSPTQAESVD